MDKNKIFNIIQEDIGEIEKQLVDRTGSGELWDSLKTKYSIILPEIIKTIKEGGKIAGLGQEFDYRPELKMLKTALLTWILINEENLAVSGNDINNYSKDLIKERIPIDTEEELNNLIIESKIYISKDSYNEKKIGLEKIWDAFERMKTIKETDKKNSINTIISHITKDDKKMAEMIHAEFKTLTDIGNSYSIRHSETFQKKLPNEHFIEYLYFRMLSLISFVLNLL